MNISSRCEYGARAILELARRAHELAPAAAVQIAHSQSIPEKYLVHILLQLKRAGLVRSVRGAHGGYLLARPADQITLRDIVRAIDGPVLEPLPVKDQAAQELKRAWHAAGNRVEDVLAKITIREIMEEEHQGKMYYI